MPSRLWCKNILTSLILSDCTKFIITKIFRSDLLNVDDMEKQEEKRSYEEKIQAQLDEWRDDIDRLKERAKHVSVESKLKYQESIDKLELRMKEGKSKLKDLAESSDDAWDSIKDGAESIWDTMKVTFREVKEKFRDDEEKNKE